MNAATMRPVHSMPTWATALLAAAGILLWLLLLAVAPLRWPAYFDFQVLYHANMGLLRGIALYDHAAQVNMIAQLARVAPEQVYVLPFPYPPWYALSTLWLALMPIESATRIWLGINLVLVVASTWLLSEGWQPWKRLAAAAISVFFLPVQGSLLVGQYTFPVLFGCALMLHALRHERAAEAALAAILLTFKPHVGGLVLLAALVYLWRRRDTFGRRALLSIAGAGALLFALGFLADPGWPVNYLRSLTGFRQMSGVSLCTQCSGLPIIVSEWLLRGGLTGALVIGILMLCALAALWLFTRGALLWNPEIVVSASVLAVLLASPYLLKYDFVLMVAPLALLAGRQRNLPGWLLLAAAFGLPLLLLVLPPRQGDLVLAACAAGLMVMLYLEQAPLDVSRAPA